MEMIAALWDYALPFAIVFSLIYFILRLLKSGLFDECKINVVENVPHLSKSAIVYYKYRVGCYSGVNKKVHDEVKQLVPRGAKTFGIYYDDPREVKAELCQSAIGVIFGEDGTDFYDDNYANQLNRWGFERMTLPAVQRAVVARQPYDGALSLLVMVHKTYKAISHFILDNRLEAGPSVEVYSTDDSGKSVVDVIFPLDLSSELFVQEYVSTEKLESKLASRHFDSDLSDSESEPEGDEMVDEEDEPAVAGAVAGEAAPQEQSAE